MSKLSTPNWILKGEKKPSEKKKGKTFKLRKCPECRSTGVVVILSGEEGKGSKGWGCKSCKWTGRNSEKKEMSEDEFMEHLDKMGGK